MTDISSATSDRPLDPRLNWATLSQAEHDAAYDNNAAVKNSPALIAERNEASAQFRATHNATLDIPYATRERNKFDLYPAADKARAMSGLSLTATGSAIRARCSRCWCRASPPTAGRLRFPAIRWHPRSH